MEKELTPDEVIAELGGCGKFQWRLNIIGHLMKTLICFSTTSMILISATPPWRCSEADLCAVSSSVNNTKNNNSDNSVYTCPTKLCTIGNKSCERFQFDDGLTTMVSEVWNVFGNEAMGIYVHHIFRLNFNIKIFAALLQCLFIAFYLSNWYFNKPEGILCCWYIMHINAHKVIAWTLIQALKSVLLY